MKLRIKSFSPVAHWQWNLDNSKPIDSQKHEPKTSPALSSDSSSQHDDNFPDNHKPNPTTVEEEEDLCGICQVAFEGCCPECKVPGDDCPLSLFPPLFLTKNHTQNPLPIFFFFFFFLKTVWGECTHIFHMHCLLKWISQESSKQACPMDRQPWGEFKLKLGIFFFF